MKSVTIQYGKNRKYLSTLARVFFYEALVIEQFISPGLILSDSHGNRSYADCRRAHTKDLIFVCVGTFNTSTDRPQSFP